MSYIDLVFTGPPDHEMPQFIEAENPQGESIIAGIWQQRPDANQTAFTNGSSDSWQVRTWSYLRGKSVRTGPSGATRLRSSQRRFSVNFYSPQIGEHDDPTANV